MSYLPIPLLITTDCYGPQPVSQQGNRATDDGALGLPKETPRMTEQGISVGWYTAMGTW